MRPRERETRAHVVRGDVVGGDADNVLVRVVGGGVEGESGLAREDADVPLLGLKGPGERVGAVGVEGDADAAVEVCAGDEAFGEEARLVGLRGACVARRGAEDAVQGDGEVRGGGDDEDGGGRVEQEGAVAVAVVVLAGVLVGGGAWSRGWWWWWG